jgi:hypothetical protein
MSLLFALVDAMIATKSADLDGKKSIGRVFVEAVVLLAILFAIAAILIAIGLLTDPRNWL